MRIGETTFAAVQRETLLFKDTKSPRANIFFSEFDQFVTLRLKTSKNDVDYTRILIVVRETHQQNRLLMTFCKLFLWNAKLTDALLFSQTKKKFSSEYLIDILKSRFAGCMIDTKNFSGQSFRRDII